MANFEVVRVRLPEYETPSNKPATLSCEFKFEQRRRRRYCPCRRKTDVQIQTLEPTADEFRAFWRAFNENGVQIALFSIDMRSKAKFVKTRIVDSMRCVATVSRNMLECDDESEVAGLDSSSSPPKKHSLFTQGTSHTATQESSRSRVEKVFKAYGDIGGVLSSKGGVSRLVGPEPGQVVELQFRAPQTQSFKFERCQPCQNFHLILECWALHKKFEKESAPQGKKDRSGYTGFKPLLKRQEATSSLGSRVWTNMTTNMGRIWMSIKGDVEEKEYIEPEVNEWRPSDYTAWRRLWDAGDDMIHEDKLRRGVAVTDVMEVQFRKDAVLLFNTLFPNVSPTTLLGIVCACSPSLLQENDPVVERCKHRVLRICEEGGFGNSPKAQAVLDVALRYGGGGVAKRMSQMSRSLSDYTRSQSKSFVPFSSFNGTASNDSTSLPNLPSTKHFLSPTRSYLGWDTRQKNSADGSAKNAIESYALTVLFMKRLLICLALCGVHFTEEDNLPALGEVWPFPLASLFGHGNRILFRLEEIDVYEFLNILFKGDPRAHDWRKRGVPSPFTKRVAASHSVTVEDGFLAERLLTATKATDVVGNISDGLAGRHLGLDLPLGGLGNATPIWKMGTKTFACVGFRGEAVLEDRYNCKAGVQGGHLYLRVDEFGEQMRGAAWHVSSNLDDINRKFDLHAMVQSKSHHVSKGKHDAEAKKLQAARSKRISSCPPRIPHGNFGIASAADPYVENSVDSITPRSPPTPTDKELPRIISKPWMWKALANFGTIHAPPSLSSMKAMLEACGVCNLTEAQLEALFHELQHNHAALELHAGFQIVRVMRKVVLSIECQECSLLNVGVQAHSVDSIRGDGDGDDEVAVDNKFSAFNETFHETLKHSQPKFLTMVVRLPHETEDKAALRALEEYMPQLHNELPQAQLVDFLRSSENWREEIDDRESKVFPGLTCHRCTRIYQLQGDRFSWIFRALQRANLVNSETGEVIDDTVRSGINPKTSISLLWRWFSMDRVEMMGLGSFKGFRASEFVDQEDEMYADPSVSQSTHSTHACENSTSTFGFAGNARRRKRSTRPRVVHTDVAYKKVSSLMLGLESAAPMKSSPIGQAHNAAAVSNTFSSMNNWKWRFYRKYNALQCPADIGALRVSITKRRLRLLKEVLDCLDILNPVDEWVQQSSEVSDSMWRCRHSLNQRHIEEVLFQDILSKPLAEARSAVLVYAERRSKKLVRASLDRYGLDRASREVRDRHGFHKWYTDFGISEYGLPVGEFMVPPTPTDTPMDANWRASSTSQTNTSSMKDSSVKGSDSQSSKRQTLLSGRTLSVVWNEKIEESTNSQAFGETVTDEFHSGKSGERSKFKTHGHSMSFLQRSKGHISLSDCKLPDPRSQSYESSGFRNRESRKNSTTSDQSRGSFNSHCSSELEGRRFFVSGSSRNFDEASPRNSTEGERGSSNNLFFSSEVFFSNEVDHCDCVDSPDAESLKIRISARQYDKTDHLVDMGLRPHDWEELPDTTDPLPESEMEEGKLNRLPETPVLEPPVCFRCHTPRGASVAAGSSSSAPSCCVCNIYIPGGPEANPSQQPMLRPNG